MEFAGSSVLKFIACKFSEEKMNEIVVTLCKCICLETTITNFIDIDYTASTELTRDNRAFCTREEKSNRNERGRRMLLPSHGVVDFTSTSKGSGARLGIRCSGVLKSSACKFSDEKMNQIIYSV